MWNVIFIPLPPVHDRHVDVHPLTRPWMAPMPELVNQLPARAWRPARPYVLPVLAVMGLALGVAGELQSAPGLRPGNGAALDEVRVYHGASSCEHMQSWKVNSPSSLDQGISVSPTTA